MKNVGGEAFGKVPIQTKVSDQSYQSCYWFSLIDAKESAS